MASEGQQAGDKGAAKEPRIHLLCQLDDFRYQQLRLHKRGRLHHISFTFRFSSGRRPADRPALLLQSVLQSEPYHRLIFDHAVLAWPGVHGPFSIARLSPSDFAPLEPQLAVLEITDVLAVDKWLSPPPDPARIRLALEFVRHHAARAQQAFYLTPCQQFNAQARRGEGLHHEWSHALVEFHEYLFIDRRLTGSRGGRCDLFFLAYE